MKKLLFTLGVVAIMLANQKVYAVNAGTVINNQASLEYVAGNEAYTASSNVSSFTVQELIDVTTAFLTSNEQNVASPDTKKFVSIRITNSGNGKQSYFLQSDNNLGNDDFNPIANGAVIYIENEAQVGFQLNGANADTVYSSGAVSLEAGQSVVVYLVYDIPSNLNPLNKGNVSLKVTNSMIGDKPTGSIIEGQGANGVDIIVGNSGGKSEIVATYIVNSSIVTMNKSVKEIKDLNGGNTIQSGSTITYNVEIKIQGTGTINNFIAKDTLPIALNYIAGTLKLNNSPLTDINDVDMGNFNSADNSINLNLGNQSAPALYNLEYKTLIN